MKHILKATVILACMSGPVYAQQVIAKGSWSEVATSDNGPVTLGVASTAAACVADIKSGFAAMLAQAKADTDAAAAAQAAGDPIPEQNSLNDTAGADVARTWLYEDANCVQN